jgi:hypothetical protein
MLLRVRNDGKHYILDANKETLCEVKQQLLVCVYARMPPFFLAWATARRRRKCNGMRILDCLRLLDLTGLRCSQHLDCSFPFSNLVQNANRLPLSHTEF